MKHITFSHAYLDSNKGAAPQRPRPVVFMTVVMFVLIGLFTAGQQEADLTATLQEQSIPVEAIELKGDVVTARLNYEGGATGSVARAEEEMLLLFSKIAERYPQSRRIVLDSRAGETRISEIEVETESALSYARGKKSARELLAEVRMVAHLDVEGVMEEAIASRTPAESPPAASLPEKIIAGSERRPSREGSAGSSGRRGGGSPASPSISIPWPLLGLLAILLAGVGLIIALVLKRRGTAAGSQKVSARLEVIYQDGGRERYKIRAARTAIGRAGDNSLVIRDPDVSSHHAEIVVSGNHFILRDLASTNGTFLNGERINEAQLYLGDEIRLGSTKIVLANGS
ncbi:MAG: FHA domain-containing protein [Candidatus Aminicenantales bacterium]